MFSLSVFEMQDSGIQNQLIDSLRAGVCHVSVDGSIIYTNKSAASLIGFPPEELVGQKYFEVFFGVSDPDLDARCGPFEFAIHEGEISHVVSEEIATKTGSHIAVEFFCAPLEEGGAVISFDDISVRFEVENEISEARERALAAAEAKSRFLANMSHEIRTPLSGIKGTAEILSDTELDEEQSELVEVLRSSAEYLNSIVNDVLDFSKLEAGKYNVEASTFDVKTLIEQTITFYRNSPESIELKLSSTHSGPSLIVTGERAVRQILNNLINNAVKFTESGYVRVESSVENGRLTIEVEDSGDGVEEAYVSRMFDPFEQEDDGDTKGIRRDWSRSFNLPETRVRTGREIDLFEGCVRRVEVFF